MFSVVVCSICSRERLVCDMCKRVLLWDNISHVEREFVRMHVLRRTLCVHVCSERCVSRFDEYLGAEAVGGRLSVKRMFVGGDRVESVRTRLVEALPRVRLCLLKEKGRYWGKTALKVVPRAAQSGAALRWSGVLCCD